MLIDGTPRDAEPTECPYLPDRHFVQQHFWGKEVSADETEILLSAGWRHFGSFFFRPHCGACQACLPLRVDVRQFQPSASQRRVERKNLDVEFQIQPLTYRDEYFELYRDHNQHRFGKDADPDHFRESFFAPAVPSFVTEYRIDGQLAALGFCDQSRAGLSSVYFLYHHAFAQRSLGIYSVLRECQWARDQGLAWYYLGYYIRENPTMQYKGRFFPRQMLDWASGVWI